MKKNVIFFVIIIFFILTFFIFKKKEPVKAQIQDMQGFIRIDGGFFIMGSPRNELGRKSKGGVENRRLVFIKSFYIAQYEVTQKEYYSIINNEKLLIEDENIPIYNINWFDAIEFCNKLSELHGLNPVYTIFYDRIKDDSTVNYIRNIVKWNKKANGYRLPTSAEWECVIRAETRTPYYTGITMLETQANFNQYFPNFDKVSIMPIGNYPPNPWELYDMAGNAWEWCWDWYERFIPSTGKIIRGGSYNSSVKDLRSAALSASTISGRGSAGIRLVRSALP